MLSQLMIIYIWENIMQCNKSNYKMKTPEGPEDCLKFKQEADSFCLQVKLAQNKLLVSLNDYNQWIKYQRQFTQEDIGKSIHKKLQLIDIFSSFSDIGKFNDAVLTKEKDQGREFINYTFGSVISNHGRPLYKIQSNGRITTYTQVIFRRNNEQVQQIFQSNLNLEKIGKMNEVEIMVTKMSGEKKQLVSKFQYKIQNLTTENQVLKGKITDLQQQNLELMKRMGMAEESVNELKKTQKQMSDTFNQKFKQVEVLKTDATLPYSNKFMILKNMITYIGQNSSFTQYLFNYQIPYNKTCKFSIRVIKSVSKNLMFGIIDLQKQRNARTSYSSNNAFAYYAHAYKYPSSMMEGSGFKQGDVVEVIVNLSAETIKWNVNGIQNAQTTSNILGEVGRHFVPYIQFYETNQCIQWCGNSQI